MHYEIQLFFLHFKHVLIKYYVFLFNLKSLTDSGKPRKTGNN